MKRRHNHPVAVKKSCALSKPCMVDRWNSGQVFLVPGLGRKPSPKKDLFPATSDSFAT